ncbi:uncharacterized protein L969DRAFT_96498 [Mixia osmundae IAM 14324]|uniref:Nuclear segregation protein Bfr1 n=1 Tax=Mixia osmundae (strain CBS 9802 / IAM 14324 / JCM 22182 / KY 12970) TaxID=764103 RepID=G7DUV2_MIXOS|nr:uncharacterized protein L969DRAFT_96498 [Mixia osmundae IAM 14324]KEI37420.1 hypothetical protein L969DRAFT_96498 [Mixia osmundae IAM 14324]GAA94362.1 hypothetical protein E5Q_01013 [Mixia osmundae IAM 14324]
MPPKANGKAPVSGAKADAAASSFGKAVAGSINDAKAAKAADQATASTHGKPDKAAYDKRQEELTTKLMSAQKAVASIKAKINDSDPKNASGPQSERRKVLKEELDKLRGQQSTYSASRKKALDQIKSLQDGIQRKSKELQDSRGKSKYRSTTEVDNQISSLEKQVEAGTMKLVDEKRALAEISNLKKSRKVIEGFGGQGDSIEADKKKIDEIRAQMDNPESKAASDRYTTIKSELDAIQKDGDAAYKSRSALYDERNALQKKADEIYNLRKTERAAFREANDKYYQKMTEDRNRRLEKEKAERQAYDDAKREETNARLLEEAKAPAYEREIEDCKTLVEYLQKMTGESTAAIEEPKLNVASTSSKLPQLETRKVDEAVPEGSVVAAKKTQDDDDYFGGLSKKKKSSKKSNAPSSGKLSLPMSTYAALISFDVTPPVSHSDLPKVIEQLSTKKTWYVEHQDEETKKRIAAIEKKIADAEAKTKAAAAPAGKTTAEVVAEGADDTTEEITESKAEDATAATAAA